MMVLSAGHMADNGAQRLDVHAVFQGGGGEGVPQIMEPQALALRPFQHRLKPLPDGGRVQRGVLLHGRGEHPPGVDTIFIGLEHVQDRGGEEHRPIARPGQLQEEQFVASVLPGLDQQPLDLLWGQNLHFPALDRRKFTTVRWVAEDQLLLHCLVQCRVEGGVNAPDGLIRETCTIEFCAQQPPTLFQAGIELLDVPGGQLVQLDMA